MDIATDESIPRIGRYRYGYGPESGYRYGHGQTHRHRHRRTGFHLFGKRSDSFSTGGGCLNVDMNTHRPHRYL